LAYPKGLYEDVPYHIKLLSAADYVAVLDIPTWHYRTGRKGQVSVERSKRRFDLVSNFNLALSNMRASKMSNEHGAAFLQSCVWPLFWSSLYLPFECRREYFSRVCEVFQSVPQEWIRTYYLTIEPNPLWFVIWCLRHRYIQGLVRRSAGAQTKVWKALCFYGDVLGPIAALRAVFTAMSSRYRGAHP
jgi:hypothetical protein